MNRYWIVCGTCNQYTVITDLANKAMTSCLGCNALNHWIAHGHIHDPEMGATPAPILNVAITPPVAGPAPIKKAIIHPFASKDDWRNH